MSALDKAEWNIINGIYAWGIEPVTLIKEKEDLNVFVHDKMNRKGKGTGREQWNSAYCASKAAFV